MKINYFLLSFLIIFKIFDIITTYIGLSLGYIETNLFGFTFVSVVISFFPSMAILFIIVWFKKDKLLQYVSFGLLLFLNIIGCFVVINNIHLIIL